MTTLGDVFYTILKQTNQTRPMALTIVPIFFNFCWVGCKAKPFIGPWEKVYKCLLSYSWMRMLRRFRGNIAALVSNAFIFCEQLIASTIRWLGGTPKRLIRIKTLLIFGMVIQVLRFEHIFGIVSKFVGFKTWNDTIVDRRILILSRSKLTLIGFDRLGGIWNLSSSTIR